MFGGGAMRPKTAPVCYEHGDESATAPGRLERGGAEGLATLA